MTKNSHQACFKHREAKKVFLGFLNPFSSEKGFKPPEGSEALHPFRFAVHK